MTAYLVVADETVGRQTVFAFLNRVKDDFKKRFAGGKADTALANSLDREFGYRVIFACIDDLSWKSASRAKSADLPDTNLEPLHRPKLKEHMQYVVDHPGEVDKISKIKAQVAEVKGVMMDNIDKVCLVFFSPWSASARLSALDLSPKWVFPNGVVDCFLVEANWKIVRWCCQVCVNCETRDPTHSTPDDLVGCMCECVTTAVCGGKFM